MSKLVTTVRSLPRTLIDTTFNAARLPLTAAERVTGQGGNEEWPPALAFEGGQAAVETVLGGLLRDDELVSRGRLRQARLGKLKTAGQLEAVAEEERTRAQQRLQQQRERNEQVRDQAESRADEREQKVGQQAQKRTAQVQKSAQARKQAVRKQAAATEAALDKQERTAKLVGLTAEA